MARLSQIIVTLLGIVALGLLVFLLNTVSTNRPRRDMAQQAETPLVVTTAPSDVGQHITNSLPTPLASTPTPTVGAIPSTTALPSALVSSPAPPIAPTATSLTDPTPLPAPTLALFQFPTVVPPALPELIDQPTTAFWIYAVRGDELWRIDNLGQERQLLVNTDEMLGQSLTTLPEALSGTDCCWTWPRIVVSPDRERVALVTLPPDVNYLDEDSFAFSIYWFDIATKELAPIGEGFFPVWSPDGHRMAFQRYASGVASLWVADMESGDVRTVVEQAPPGMQFSEVVWSPDGSQIAFVYGTGNANNPGIGRVDSTGEGVPHELVSPDAGEAPYHLVWTPDGQRLLYLSYNAAVPTSLISRNLWSLEVSTGSRAQLTTGWEIADYDLAPNNPWLAFTATALFESPDLALEGDTEGIEVDLWLLNMDTEEVRRLTFQEGFPGGLGGWSPNGTQIVVWISGSVTDPHSLQFYSLVDGTNTTFTLEPDYQFVAIGGEK